MPKFTVDEIAARWRLDRPAAEGLVRFLVTVRQARSRGERAPASGVGRGPKVYSIEDDVLKALGRLAKARSRPKPPKPATEPLPPADQGSLDGNE